MMRRKTIFLTVMAAIFGVVIFSLPVLAAGSGQCGGGGGCGGGGAKACCACCGGHSHCCCKRMGQSGCCGQGMQSGQQKSGCEAMKAGKCPGHGATK